MMTKVLKFAFTVLVTKWIADATSRAAHDPRVENIEHKVRRWSSTMLKKVVMASLGSVFFATGLVMTLMSAASRADLGLSLLSYRTATAFLIFLAGCALIAAAYNYRKSRQGSIFSAEGRRTGPRFIDASY